MKRRYLGMSFIIGYCLLLIVMVTACCCTTQDDVARITGGDGPREVASVGDKVTPTAVPVEALPTTTTTTVTVEPSISHDVRICYFYVSDKITGTSQYASVKLSWAIDNADEFRTRLDDHWVQPIGHEWVQVPVGVEIPFRLVAHGVDGSVDIKLITILVR